MAELALFTVRHLVGEFIVASSSGFTSMEFLIGRTLNAMLSPRRATSVQALKLMGLNLEGVDEENDPDAPAGGDTSYSLATLGRDSIRCFTTCSSKHR